MSCRARALAPSWAAPSQGQATLSTALCPVGSRKTLLGHLSAKLPNPASALPSSSGITRGIPQPSPACQYSPRVSLAGASRRHRLLVILSGIGKTDFSAKTRQQNCFTEETVMGWPGCPQWAGVGRNGSVQSIKLSSPGRFRQRGQETVVMSRP